MPRLMRSPSRRLPILVVGLCLAELFLTISEIVGGFIEIASPWTRVPLIILQTFTFARESLSEVAPTIERSLIEPWSYYALDDLIYLVASLTTLGAIASLVLKTFTVYTLGVTSRRTDVYVFSRVNEPALALARSTASHYAELEEGTRGETKGCLILYSAAAEGFVDEMASIASGGDACAAPSVVIRRVNRVRDLMYDILQVYPVFFSSPIRVEGAPTDEGERG